MPNGVCLAHLVRRDWLTGGPLNELIVSYIEMLQHWRYARNTLSSYLRCVAHFSYWMRGEGLIAADINLALIKRILQHHLPTCTCSAPCRSEMKEVLAALHHLLDLLPKTDDETATPAHIAAELAHFANYLHQTCGLAPLICTYRVRHVGAFLVSCFGNEVASRQ